MTRDKTTSDARARSFVSRSDHMHLAVAFRPRKSVSDSVALATPESQPSLRDEIFCWLTVASRPRLNSVAANAASESTSMNVLENTITTRYTSQNFNSAHN